MKGGYRPGSGRPKGSLDKKPRTVKFPAQEAKAKAELAATLLRDHELAIQIEAERIAQAEQIHNLLTIGQKAKLKFYQEFLIRAANKDSKQKPLSIQEMRHMEKLGVELAEITEKLVPLVAPTSANNLEAGEYLYQVWNDPNIDLSLRIRAAEIVFRVDGDKKGKKEEAEEKVAEASKGKFSSGRAPLSLVK